MTKQPVAADWRARAASLPSLFIADNELAGANKKPIFVTPITIGTLKVTSGRIVGGQVLGSAFDDEFPDLAEREKPVPFDRAAPVGEFPVEVSLAELTNELSRIAAARIVFSSQPIASWELAVGGTGAGFTGTFGLYMDADAIPALQTYARAAADKFFWNHDVPKHAGKLWEYSCFQPDKSRPENIAVFSTGEYEGVFVSYWGLDAAGNPVALVTDFNVIPSGVFATEPTPVAKRDGGVDMLRCPSCSGAVPLGEGDVMHCPFCATAVPLSPEHGALRDAHRADEATRRDAEAYYAKLSAPPPAAIRMLGKENVSLAMVLLSPFLFLIALVGGIFGMSLAEHVAHADFHDIHTPKWNDTYAAVIETVVLVVIVMLGAFGRRFARGRIHLRAALAAKAPERTGGPALCRACGAPLSVAAGALGARCTYCRADNLVVASAAVVATGDKVAGRRKLRRAKVEAEREASADLGRVIGSIVIRTVLLSVLLVAVWAEPLHDPGGMHDPMTYDQFLTFDRSARFVTAATCDHTAQAIALRYREVVRGSRDGDAPLDVRVSSGEHDVRLIASDSWAPGKPYEYVAPHSGMYYVCVRGPAAHVSLDVATVSASAGR